MANKDAKNNRTSSEDERKKDDRIRRISDSSQKVVKSYNLAKKALGYVFHGFSVLVDKVFFDPRFAVIVSFVLAVAMYFVVNFNQIASVYTAAVRSAREKTGITVVAEYNSDAYEISGLPETADVTLIGDATSVTNAYNYNGTVVADLEGLEEGTYEITLTAEGFGDNVSVKINPSNVYVTLKQKETREFMLSYDFINRDEMDSQYLPGTPVFASDTVNVRAAEDTLDSIAFVKALIDCANQTEQFEQDAKLVAYDSKGQVVTADILPKTVHVTVPVTSASKLVKVAVEITGSLPEDIAIVSVTPDINEVTLYGSEDALSSIESVTVSVDVEALSESTTVQLPIVLPEGVTYASSGRVILNIVTEAAVSVTVSDVKINFINTPKDYLVTQPDGIDSLSVTVRGAYENITQVTADDIYVYVDLAKAAPGTGEYALAIEPPDSEFISYELRQTAIELEITDTTQTDETEESDHG